MKWTGLVAMAFALWVAPAAGAQVGADDPAQVEAGRAVFERNCASCHTSEGVGSRAGRPLTDIALEEPDRSVHIDSVTNGKGAMPAFGAALSIKQNELYPPSASACRSANIFSTSVCKNWAAVSGVIVPSRAILLITVGISNRPSISPTTARSVAS